MMSGFQSAFSRFIRTGTNDSLEKCRSDSSVPIESTSHSSDSACSCALSLPVLCRPLRIEANLLESVERPKMSSKLPPPSFRSRAFRATFELSAGASAGEAAAPVAPPEAGATLASASAMLGDAFAGLGLAAAAAAFLPLGELRSGLADFPDGAGAASRARFFWRGTARGEARGEAARGDLRGRAAPAGLHSRRQSTIRSMVQTTRSQVVLNVQGQSGTRTRAPSNVRARGGEGLGRQQWASHPLHSAAERGALPLRAHDTPSGRG